MRSMLCIAVALSLAACGHDAPRPTSIPVAPLHLSPELCTDPQPRPPLPDTAGLQRPQTAALRDATEAFLTWAALIIDHDKALTERAQKTAASEACK